MYHIQVHFTVALLFMDLLLHHLFFFMYYYHFYLFVCLSNSGQYYFMYIFGKELIFCLANVCDNFTDNLMVVDVVQSLKPWIIKLKKGVEMPLRYGWIQFYTCNTRCKKNIRHYHATAQNVWNRNPLGSISTSAITLCCVDVTVVVGNNSK